MFPILKLKSRGSEAESHCDVKAIKIQEMAKIILEAKALGCRYIQKSIFMIAK